MPRSRYFTNKLPDLTKGSDVEILIAKWKERSESIANTVAEKMAPNLDQCDGGLYVGNVGVAYMFYYLSTCEAFLDKRKLFLEKAFEYFGVSLKYYTKRGSEMAGPSLILGRGGVLAVGILIAKAMGNETLCAEYIEQYASYAKEVQPIDFLSCGSDELFVGRAGYLCGVWTLQNKLGKKVL